MQALPSNLELQWNISKNSEAANTQPVNRKKKVWWMCEKNHEWEASTANRIKGSGCPICSNFTVLKSFNDLATTHPEIAAQWHPTKNGALTPDSVTAGSSKTGWWLGECGHEWNALIKTRKVGNGCPVCSNFIILEGFNDLNTTHPDVAAQWHPTKNGTLTATEVSAGSRRKIWWQDMQGHEWEASLTSRNKGTGCPACASVSILVGFNDLATTHSEIAAEWHPTKNSYSSDKVTSSSAQKIWWLCIEGHEWEAVVYSRTRGSFCPVCTDSIALAGFNDILTTHPDVAAQWHPLLNPTVDILTITHGSSRKVWWLGSCNHEWEAAVNNRTRGSQCFECSIKQYISQPEKDLFHFLKNLGLTVETSNRKILHGKEIDLYLPDYQLGIEFNGLYWHTEEMGKDRTYHYDKYIAAKNAGIQLIQIWEDDWNHRKPVILRALAHKLGVTDKLAVLYPDMAAVTQKIFARKTQVIEISTVKAKLFMAENHIQGFASGSYYVGLKDSNDRLRALMVLKKEGVNTLNIIRYATAGSVVGGFTKLLAYVTKTYKPDSYVTFADHCISDGYLYENTGFVADKDIPPDYKYVFQNLRKHKFGYRLKRFKNDPDLLWEENFSERELALLNNIPRIWDAGKTKYTKSCLPEDR